MTLDSLSYIAPARLRALLCPLGRIRRSRFSSFVDRLQDANVVRLGDVTPDSQPDRTMFNPQAFPDGEIMWDLSTSFDREHDYLELFELHRRTFLVIAVADHAEKNDPEVLSKQLEELKFLYPSALHHVCVIFEAPSEVLLNDKLKAHSDHPCFLAVPVKEETRLTAMRTLMCDITASVLSEMSVFSRTLLDLPTLESPLENRSQANVKNHRISMPAGSGGLAPFGGDSTAHKRKTMAGFGAGGSSERARSKGKGRVQIAVAQLHLLSGRVPDALKGFTEGADVCRSSNDHLWHGKALDGIGVCLVILAHLKDHFQIPHIPYPTLEGPKSSKSSPAASKPSTPTPPAANGHEQPGTPQRVLELLPELHAAVVNLYQRAQNFPGEAVPNISFCETILRYAKLLASIYLSNGKIGDAIAHIVSGTPIPHKGPRKDKPSRVEIAETVMGAYPQPVEVMTVQEATKVLSGIASILGTIGMKRRKAMVTRELLKILIPGLIQARVVGAAEVGVHPAAGLAALSGGNSPLDLGEGDVESGVMELLEDLCRAYGMFTGTSADELFRQEGRSQNRASDGTITMKTSVWTKAVIAEQEIRSFGWPALKIQVLRNCTSLCEALPDFQGVLKFTAQLLKTADTELTKEEQIRLSATISRTVGAARKLGLAQVEAEYWDQFLLRDVDLVEDTTWRPPIPHNYSELDDADSLMSPTSAIDVEKTPFIYNPFKAKERSMAERILVKGEPTEFRITLQNPFEFEVRVESVSLDATGVDLRAQPAGVDLQPFRTYQVFILATPNETGDVSISGCRIKVYGCKERTFPIFTEGLDSRERETKTKRFGLKAAQPNIERPVSTISSSGRGSLRPPPVLHPIPKSLSLTVVEPQPLLVVKHTSLSQSALMILEGERRIFQITLQNLSSIDVDLLVFSFTDSTTGRIQQALAEKSNSPAETFELELMLSKKRAFTWRRPQARASLRTPSTPLADNGVTRIDTNAPGLHTDHKIFVPAQGAATFEIEALGKPGLTHGTIQADYSHLGQSQNEATTRFYTREVVYPVTVTVNASIELARVDIAPFSTDFNLSSPKDAYGPFKELFASLGIHDDPSEYCLLLLDLRNAWPQPLKIALGISDPENSDKTFTSTDVLQAGHTSRIILPVKRIFIPDPTKSIPSISASQRQFVVSATKISVESERQGREAFWYREALLSRLQGTWEEMRTDRKGDIELRGIRLSPRMVETLRVEDVGISLSVDPGDGVKALSLARYIVATDRFLTLTVTITNRTSRRIRPVLRLLPELKNQEPPSGMDLNRRLAINGLLQQAVSALEPGGRGEVRTGFVALAKGEYELSASVEEVTAGESMEVEVGGLDEQGRPLDVLLGATGARKSWVCRKVLRIVARDVEGEE